MLKEVLEDALKKGERLKKEVVGQVLNSAVLNELLSSERFARAVTKIVETKEEVVKTVRRNVQDLLKLMSVPSHEQMTAYEKRVRTLEHQIDTLGRQLMRSGLKKKSSGHPVRKAARKRR
ncbi:MAG: hypothetical protein HYT77_02375 [Deltaproteobacteria bacterium]|nr:hypothetical protein [Deltaproteobacteria bacterium]